MKSSPITLVIAGLLFVGTTWSYQQTVPQSGKLKEAPPADGNVSSTILAGVAIDSALKILDDAGFKKEGGWDWGSKDPDPQVTWRKISNGIEIAIFYSKKTQSVTGIAMMYIPPTYDHKGNYVIVPTDSVVFNPDSTYVVTFQKPKPLKGG